MDMIEQSMKQYERIRKGYPQLFSDAQKIAKLIIKASKKDFEPVKTWRYLQRLKQIESRKKGYRPVPDMVINIFLDAKLTRDEERAKVKQYYLNVLRAGQKDVNDMSLLKEYVRLILEDVAPKLAPAKKGDIVNVSTNNDTAIFVAPDVSDLVNKTYGGMGGFPGADTPEGVLSRFTDFYLSDVDEDPEPDAGILYTDWKGSKKASALVTDGGPESKIKLRDMMNSFFNQNGSWIEVSGAPANILISKMGMPTVDDEETVRKLLPQIKDLRWHGKHPEGIAYGNGWYTRNIAGHDETKIIVGNPPGV